MTLADEGKRLSVDALSDSARAAFERVLQEWAATGEAFSSDSMREQLDLAGVPNRARGGLISGAQARGVIRHVGFVRSTHSATHGKWISQYEGAS